MNIISLFAFAAEVADGCGWVMVIVEYMVVVDVVVSSALLLVLVEVGSVLDVVKSIGITAISLEEDEDDEVVDIEDGDEVESDDVIVADDGNTVVEVVTVSVTTKTPIFPPKAPRPHAGLGDVLCASVCLATRLTRPAKMYVNLILVTLVTQVCF